MEPAPINNFTPRSSRFPGGCWPTASQTLLLRAALLEPATALAAWEEWKRREDFEAIDSGSFRLLGLIWRNLKAAGAADPLLPRMQGVYRRFWTVNQLLLGRNIGVLRALAAAKISAMLTKGAALVVSVYKDFGTRPMDDFDLLVPRAEAVRTMGLLEELGWRPEVLNAKELPESLHACHYRDEGHGVIDLHWQSFHFAVPEAQEQSVWDQSAIHTFHGIEIRTPSLSDQFLRACEHGVRYNVVPPFRWLADCFHIWRVSDGHLDWDRIARGARLTESVLAVRETLQFLRDRLDVSLPAEAFTRLGQTPVSLYERIESRVVRRPCRSLWDKLPWDLAWHLRSTRGRPWRERVTSFPRYFRHSNNLAAGQFSTHYRAQVKNWFQVWLPYHVRQLPRLGRARGAGEVCSLPAGAFTAFYELEPAGPRLIRWSQPEAALRLPRPEGRNLAVILRTCPIRDWHRDLSRHLRFRIDGRLVCPESVRERGGVITIPFTTTALAGRMVEVAWTCEPLSGKGDPRALGLPLFAAEVRQEENQSATSAVSSVDSATLSDAPA